jgi:photosystem II stability/assembly factor-like uncharacterized protein
MKRHLIALAAALLVLPATAAAETGSWTQVGPVGGQAHALVADAGTAGRLYAVSGSPERVWRTDDAGVSWTALTLPAHDGALIDRITPDPAHPGTVFVDWYDGVVARSTDGGAHWTDIGKPVSGGSIAIVPAGGRVFALSAHVLYASDDALTSTTRVATPAIESLAADDAGGLWAVTGAVPARSLSHADAAAPTFTAVTALPASHNGVASLRTGPGGAVYLTVSDTSYRAYDHHRSWHALGMHVIGVDPYRAMVVYGIDSVHNVRHGLYRSTDGGLHWKAVGGPAARGFANAVVVDAGTAHRVVASVFAGVYGSTDGRYLSSVVAPLGRAPITAPIAVGPETIVAGYGVRTIYAVLPLGQVVLSHDDGATWLATRSGTGRFSGYDRLIADPYRPRTVYGPRWLTRDDGATWSALPAVPFGIAAREDGHTTGTLWLRSCSSGYACHPVLYTSNDGGRHLTRRHRVPASLHLVDLVPASQTTVIGLDLNHHLQRSTNGGATFKRTGTALPCVSSIATDVAHPGGVYATTAGIPCSEYGAPANGLWRSGNGGATWVRVSATAASRVAVSATGAVFAVVDGSLRRSDDHGVTFTALLPVTGPGPMNVYWGPAPAGADAFGSDENGFLWHYGQIAT